LLQSVRCERWMVQLVDGAGLGVRATADQRLQSKSRSQRGVGVGVGVREVVRCNKDGVAGVAGVAAVAAGGLLSSSRAGRCRTSVDGAAEAVEGKRLAGAARWRQARRAVERQTQAAASSSAWAVCRAMAAVRAGIGSSEIGLLSYAGGPLYDFFYFGHMTRRTL